MRNPRVRFGRRSVSIPPALQASLEESVGEGQPPWRDWRDVAQSVGLQGLLRERWELEEEARELRAALALVRGTDA